MFFHGKILLNALIYLLILEIITTDAVGNYWATSFNGFSALIILGALFALLSFFYATARKNASSFLGSFLLPLNFLGAIGLLYLINARSLQHLFILLDSFVSYLIMLSLYRLRGYEKDKTAKGLYAAASVAVLFVFYCSAIGIYLNFNISLWVLVTFFLILTMFINYQYLILLKEEKPLVLSYSLIVGLIMGEIAWAINFWPFGYLTTGAIMLIFYYVFWDLTASHFNDALSKKRVIFNFVFFFFISFLVLATSHWLPVV